MYRKVRELLRAVPIVTPYSFLQISNEQYSRACVSLLKVFENRTGLFFTTALVNDASDKAGNVPEALSGFTKCREIFIVASRRKILFWKTWTARSWFPYFPVPSNELCGKHPVCSLLQGISRVPSDYIACFCHLCHKDFNLLYLPHPGRCVSTQR